MKQQKQFKRYVPQLIKEAIDRLDHPRKDNLYTIIDLIYRKEIYYKSDKQDSYGFTEIPRAQFKQLIASSDNLNADKQFLIDQGLLICNIYYRQHETPKSYKIPREYLSHYVPVYITNKNINQRIADQIKDARKRKEKNLEFAHSKYFKTFKIDIEGAIRAIEVRTVFEIKCYCAKVKLTFTDTDISNIIKGKGALHQRLFMHNTPEGATIASIIHRYLVQTMRLNAINDGFLFFKRNTTNGRLDTNLTSLPSYLRPYLISNDKLMHIDIKNSQPFFLYCVLKDNNKIDQLELNKYAELVIGGTFYEYLQERFKAYAGKTRTREQMKRMLFRIYYSKTQSFKPEKAFFGLLFPTIMAYIRRTNLVNNNVLAIQLQNIESYTMLDVIMPLLKKSAVVPFTIHDSFICTEDEADTVKNTVTSKLVEMYGCSPALHINPLVEDQPEDDDVELDIDELLEMINLQVGDE